MSYGYDVPDNFRRASIYVDRILKGIKPSDLPVQAPVKFELVVNLKTAKALDLKNNCRAWPMAVRYARDVYKPAACSIAHSSERRTDSLVC